MDPQDNVRSSPTYGKQFSDTDLRAVKDAAYFFVSLGATAERLERLVKALSLSDTSIEDQILRRWGVR